MSREAARNYLVFSGIAVIKHISCVIHRKYTIFTTFKEVWTISCKFLGNSTVQKFCAQLEMIRCSTGLSYTIRNVSDQSQIHSIGQYSNPKLKVTPLSLWVHKWQHKLHLSNSLKLLPVFELCADKIWSNIPLLRLTTWAVPLKTKDC